MIPPLRSKVAHIVPSMEMGGVEKSTRLTLAQLHANGIPVILICSGGRMCQDLSDLGIPIYLLAVHSKNPVTQFLNIFRIANIVRREGVGVIHCHSRAPAWSSYFSSRLAGSHFITTFHSYYGHRALKKLYSKIMTMGEVIIAPSTALHQHIIQTYGIDSHKVIHLPHFVDRHVATDQSEIDTFKRQHAIPEGAIIVTMVARFSQSKGIHLVIEALKLLALDNLILLIVGRSKNGRVELWQTGHLDQRSSAINVRVIDGSELNIAHAFLLSYGVISASSQPEGFGLSMLEALSYEVPVIASMHGGALDLVEHGVNGLLFEPNNAADLALKIQALLMQSHGEYASMRLSARRQAEKFTANLTITKLEHIYKALDSH